MSLILIITYSAKTVNYTESCFHFSKIVARTVHTGKTNKILPFSLESVRKLQIELRFQIIRKLFIVFKVNAIRKSLKLSRIHNESVKVFISVNVV